MGNGVYSKHALSAAVVAVFVTTTVHVIYCFSIKKKSISMEEKDKPDKVDEDTTKREDPVSRESDRSSPADSTTDKSDAEEESFFTRWFRWTSTKLVSQWPPSDPHEVVQYPLEHYSQHAVIFPLHGIAETFHVRQEVQDEVMTNHVVFVSRDEKGMQHPMSLYRSDTVQLAVELCIRCRDCQTLFHCMDENADLGQYVRNLVEKLSEHMLWRSEHIAALCGIGKFFTMHKRHINQLLRTPSHPEGLYPLLIAIVSGHLDLVQLLLDLGGDPSVTDHAGNSVMHLAASTSDQMLTMLWRYPVCQDLINTVNADECTPLYLAICSANYRCTSTLISLGAYLNIRAQETSPLVTALANKTKVLQELIRVMPSLLDERDERTGNGVLHLAKQKMPLLGLLELAHDRLDLDAKNRAGQTPLHVFVHRGDLALVFAIAAYPCDLDAQDNAGNTALHIAASVGSSSNRVIGLQRGDLVIIRALLCLRADPNIENHLGDSPRHIAARLKHEATLEIVRSLAICGARRCEETKTGCAAGCVHGSLLSLLKSDVKTKETETEEMKQEKQIEEADDVEREESKMEEIVDQEEEEEGAIREKDDDPQKEKKTEKKTKKESPTEPTLLDSPDSAVDLHAATAAYEFEIDPDSNLIDEAYAAENPVRNYPQKRAYQKVLAEVEEFARTGRQSNVINALALDGGGIRGLVITQLLLTLERAMGEPVTPYFDWIAGTSTGAYVASQLALGKSVRDCQRLYLRFKDCIFDSWTRPYSDAVLEGFIKEAMGETTMLADVRHPRLLITTARADKFPVQMELMRNYRLPLQDEENNEIGFEDPSGLPLWRAARRTSAAPTYFSLAEEKYIDGGIVSNNPTLELLSEVHFYNSTVEFKGCEENIVRLGSVVSVGTGVAPIIEMNPLSLALSANPYAAAIAVKTLGMIVMDQATATEGAPVSRARSWCHSIAVPYFRFNAPMTKDVQMDCRDDCELTTLMWNCVEYSFTHRMDFYRLARLLKTIGPATNRVALFPHEETR